MSNEKAIRSSEDVYFIEMCNDPNSFMPENEDSKPTKNTVHAIENNGIATAMRQENKVGQGAAQFYLNKTEPLYEGETYRTEVTIVKAEEDARVTETGFYSFKVLFPTDGGGADDRKTSINQWFEDGSDELTLRTMYGFCFLELQNSSKVYRWDLFSTAKNEDASTTGFVLHPFEVWHQFAFHIKHHLTDGFIKVYHGEQLIHEYIGSTIHVKRPKWKIGIYSSQSKSTLPYKRVYFSEIKVGNYKATLADMIGSDVVVPPIEPPIEPPVEVIPPEFKVSLGDDVVIQAPVDDAISVANYYDMAPGSYVAKITLTDSEGKSVSDEMTITVKPVPPTSPITGFEIINAETEREVITIVEGGSYSLSGLGLKKVNIKAVTTTSITKVTFECTGPTPKTSTDKSSPFSLHGDEIKSSGGINYYYGNWGPPAVGNYTLKATPYIGDTVGESSTIHFSIVK